MRNLEPTPENVARKLKRLQIWEQVCEDITDLDLLSIAEEICGNIEKWLQSHDIKYRCDTTHSYYYQEVAE